MVWVTLLSTSKWAISCFKADACQDGLCTISSFRRCKKKQGSKGDLIHHSWPLIQGNSQKVREGSPVSSLPFDLLNSMFHWSRWSVVWKWIIEQRCYTHLILRSSCLYILGELNCQGSEKRLLKDESNSVTSHPSLLDFPLQILAYKLKSGVVSVVSLDLIYLHQSPLSSTLLTSEHHRIYIFLQIIKFYHLIFRRPFKGMMHQT